MTKKKKYYIHDTGAYIHKKKTSTKKAHIQKEETDAQKQRRIEKQENAFLKTHKENYYNYMLEFLDYFDKKTNNKFKNDKNAILNAFLEYKNRPIVIDEIMQGIREASRHSGITNSIFIDLENYYFRNYENTLKKAINSKGYTERKPRLLKNSIIGFLIGRYFSKIIFWLIIAFFVLLANINK